MATYTFTFPTAAAGLAVTIRDDEGATVDTDTLGTVTPTDGAIVLTATLDIGDYVAEAADTQTFRSFRAPGILDLHTTLAAQVPAPVNPADGEIVAWSNTLGEWVAATPTGATLIASATNTTGTATTCSTTGGLGTAVAVPGTAISVTDSAGLPVVISWFGYWQQTVAADGLGLLALYETTSSPTQIRSAYNRLPNSVAAPFTYSDTPVHYHDIGVVTTTRTFQLYIQAWTGAGVSTNIRVLNLAASPTGIRAATGL